MKTKIFLLIGLLSLCADLAHGQERMPDVRLLIDVSGSMRDSDPDNLRAPALDLMLRLLPDGSRAGVWTFGQRVNAPVPHRLVDRRWREDAAAAISTIGNRGLLTNIPDALESATFDAGRLRHDFKISVVLLTDGKVEVSEDPVDNARAARDLLTKQATELRDLGIAVHTIALSDNADWPFLRELAQTTGGLAEKADSAQALSAIFLQVLNIAAPTAQVPLLGGEFLVDASVTEFTLLVFPENPSDPLSLRDPQGQVFTELSRAASSSWFKGNGFTLVTVPAPAPGVWRVTAPGAIARVNVLADLSLQIDGPEASMPAGHEPELGLQLVEKGAAISDRELLEVLSISVVVRRDDGERWELSPADDEVPGSGEFRLKLPMLAEPGRYELAVRLDGGSFQRERRLVTDVFVPAPVLRPAAIPQPGSTVNNGWMIPAAVTLVLFAGLLLWWWSRRREEGDWQGDEAYGDPSDEARDQEDLISGIHIDDEDQRSP